MNPIPMVIAFVAASLAFIGTATAQAAAGVGDASLLDLARPVYDAIMAGNYTAAAAFALVLIVALVKRHAAPRVAFLRSDLGAALLVLALSFGGALGTAALAGGAVGVALFTGAAKVAFYAAGGFALAKKLLAPLLERLAARAPAWLSPLFAVVLWIFDRPSAVEKAEAAGAKALDANPPKGADAVTGSPDALP
jgi:hypothetical protein